MKKTVQNRSVGYSLFTFVVYNKFMYAKLQKASQIPKKAGTTMDRSRALPRLCFITTAALTLISVAVRTLCMLTAFDAEVGYLASGPMTALANALYFVTAAAVVVLAVLIPKNTLPTELCVGLRAPSACLLGLALAAFAAVAVIVCVPTSSSKLLTVTAILALPTSAYYFLSATRGGRYPDWLSFLGYLPVLWCITAVGELYFDVYVTMNSPLKVTLQTGLLGFMLISLQELRFRIGRATPRIAMVCFGMGSFACLTAAVPLLIATGAGVVSHLLHTLYAIVLLAAGLYSLYHMFRYTRPSASVLPDSEAGEEPDTPDETPEPNAE